MNRGLSRIQCVHCPAFMTASHMTRAEFAEALEERGWRMLAGKTRRDVVCPACAKKVKPADLNAPRKSSKGVGL